MSTAPRVKIRPYEAGDEDRIVDLLCPQWTHLSGPDALRNWRWEYQGGPRPAIVSVAEYGHNLVGHYAVLPMRMKCGEAGIWGGKAEGGIVSPEFRGTRGQKYLPEGETRTVYNLLIAETLRRASEEDILLVWGFPNIIGVRGQVRAGYFLISVPISRYLLPLTLTSSARQIASEVRGARNPLSLYTTLAKGWFRRLIRPTASPLPDDGLEVTDASGNESGIGALWDRYDRERNCTTIARGAEYLRWRMIENPVLRHRALVTKRDAYLTSLVSYAVHRGRVPEGRIVDMIALEGHGIDLLAALGQAARAMQGEGVAFITSWFSRNATSAPYRDALSRLGFLNSSTPAMNLLVKTYGPIEGRARDPAEWDLSMAFTEGVA